MRVRGLPASTQHLVWAAMVALALAGLVMVAGPVRAHADLAEAEPRPGAVLDESPTEVRLRFTETMAPEFSQVQVFDASGNQVDNRDTTLDPNDAHIMAVSLPPLEEGIYTVSWRNLSTVDGHPMRGSLVFSVGESAMGALSTEEALSDPVLASPLEPLARWLVLLSVVTLFAGPPFWLFVVMPIVADRKLGRETRDAVAGLAGGVRRLLWCAGGLFIVSAVFHLLVQTAVAHDLPLHQTLGAPVASLLTGTTWGGLWVWRAVLFVGMLLALYLGIRWEQRRVAEERAWPWVAALALGAGGLLTLSLASHAASISGVRYGAIFSDYLHLVAAAVWVGGLVYLAAAIGAVFRRQEGAERTALLAAIVPRFSIMAFLSVGTLAITGAYLAWAHVTSIEAVRTPYGLTLVTKVVLLLPLLGLAAANLLWVRPRRGGNDGAGRWLRVLVRGEITVAALVLLATGVMTSMQPARQAVHLLGQEASVTFEETRDGIDIALTIEPATLGPNRFEASLRDRFGRPVTTVEWVDLTLIALDADLGAQSAPMANVAPGVWVLDQALFSIAGDWQVELFMIRSDDFNSDLTVWLEVPDSAPSTRVSELDPDLGGLLWGVELLLLGLLFVGVGVPLGGWLSRKGASLMGAGTVTALAGIFLIGANPMLVGGATSHENPIPATAESLHLGEHVYAHSCSACHGIGGGGDGPDAAGLQPPPPSLVDHVPHAPDWQLFGMIRDGVPGTAMPAFGDRLSDEDIWHVINYIRMLNGEPGDVEGVSPHDAHGAH